LNGFILSPKTKIEVLLLQYLLNYYINYIFIIIQNYFLN